MDLTNPSTLRSLNRPPTQQRLVQPITLDFKEEKTVSLLFSEQTTPASSLINPNQSIAPTKTDSLEVSLSTSIEKFYEQLCFTEKENYKTYILNNISHIKATITKLIKKLEPQPDSHITFEMNIQVQKLQKNKYLVFIFDNKGSNSSSCLRGAYKIIEPNHYSIEIDLEQNIFDIKHKVVLSPDSPQFQSRIGDKYKKYTELIKNSPSKIIRRLKSSFTFPL